MQQLSGLNREQRRLSNKKIKQISIKGTPREKLSLETLNILEEKIQSYGNTLSGDHKKALLEVSDLYAKIIFNEMTGRYVVALDCGLGKTLSVVALVSAINKLGYDSRSAMICQSRVSELCLMADALLEAGVPAHKIGLIHSYKYDPLARVVDGEVLNPDGSVKLGYAAKPSNAKEDSSQFQFLLVSHNKIRGKREIVKHTQYKGKARTITIWDESFISTEATSVGLRDLKTAIQEFENTHAGRDDQTSSFVSWLKKSYDLLAQEEQSQKTGTPASVITLPHLSDEETTSYEKLAEYRNRDKRTEWRQHLRDLLGMALDPVRVSIAGGEAVLQFSDTISKQLNNLVVLDASYRIRELVRIDPTLHEPPFFVHRHNLKSYEDVTLHRLNYYGSRVAAETPDKSRKVAKEIALVIKDLPIDEGICLFTFKWHIGKQEHAEVIKEALISEGIDPSTQITLSDGSTKPRFIWKTWGQETGSNNASYCTHLFMVGVLRQQENHFLAQLVGQSQDLLRDMNQSTLSQAMVSELTHLVYQAGLRSRARIVSHGKALASHLYLVLDEPRIEGYLANIMRNLKIAEWLPQDALLKKKDVMGEVTKKILRGFEELNNGDIFDISIREFKELFDLNDVPNQTFRCARDEALHTHIGWHLPEGSRSFKRVSQNVT